jgi:cell wall-associated NlpC family hydrolase
LSIANPTTTSTELDLLENVIPPELSRPTNFRKKSNRLSVAVCTLVLPAVFATVALPAYAAVASPVSVSTHTSATASASRSQSITVADASQADIQTVARGTFNATSEATLRARKARKARNSLAIASFTGPSVGAFLADPPYPHFSLSKVVEVASKYKGVPYVFGGESPAGFDCSGLVAYVYAQFGISLPHSAAEQGAIGTKIARSAARPGDVVVMDGGAHVGIYIGGGRMIDAPEPGRVVSNDAIYDNDYYFVRFGI